MRRVVTRRAQGSSAGGSRAVAGMRRPGLRWLDRARPRAGARRGAHRIAL